MKVLVYAFGNGGGHFSRTLAVVSSLYSEKNEIHVIISSPLYLFVKNLVKNTNLKFHYTREASSARVVLLEEADNADVLIIDTLLLGSEHTLGELLPEIRSPVLFVFRHSMEETNSLFVRYIKEHPSQIDGILLPYFPEGYRGPMFQRAIFIGPQILLPHRWARFGIAIETHSISDGIRPDNSLLYDRKLKVHVVHLGSKKELNVLKSELQYLSERVEVEVKIYSPKNVIFPGFLAVVNADLVICGGGYNLLHEIIEFGKQAIAVPFQRRYDDQFARVIQFKQDYPNEVFLSSEDFIHHKIDHQGVS